MPFDLFSPEILQLAKRLNKQKNQKLAEHGLKVTTAHCLCQIAQNPNGMTASDLVRSCELDKAQISRAVQELAAKNYVCRAGERGQCYKQKYRLTNEGQCVVEDLQQSARSVRRVLGRDISESEMQSFCGTLEKICTNEKTYGGVYS